MSDEEKKVPTKRSSGTLQRGPGFRDEAVAIALNMTRLIERYTAVNMHTNTKMAIECRRLRDEASLLAIEFEGWEKVTTSTEQRVAAVDHLVDLKRRADKLVARAL